MQRGAMQRGGVQRGAMQRGGVSSHCASYYYLAYRLVENENNRGRFTREMRRRAFHRERLCSSLFDLPEWEFRKRFRLTKEAVLFLCEELRQKTSLKATRQVGLELKVLCALSFYATGSYQRIVGIAKFIGQSTVSKYVTEVTDALNEPNLMNSFIKFPVTREQRDIIKNKFDLLYGIPGVIGCVDGSHFHIFKPEKDIEHLFYCRKHFHSMNVQMICDADCRILNVNAKYGGATHDAFIWENCLANSYMQDLHQNNEHVWLLGDSGYPQRPWLMTPILNAAEGSPEALYTSVHGTARVAIENTFGRLKNRWRCLCKDRTLHYKPEKCSKIIMACSVLHNLAIDFNLPELDPSELISQNDNPLSQHDNMYVEHAAGGDLVRGRAVRSIVVNRISSSRRSRRSV